MPLPAALLAKKGAMMAARRMAIRGASNPGVRRTVGEQLARVAHSQRNAVDGYQNERRRRMPRSMPQRGNPNERGYMNYMPNPGNPNERGYMNYMPNPGNPNERRRRMPRSMPKRKLPWMAKGGKVRKTGLVYLHKGERVVPAKKVKKVENGLRKMGINLRLPKSNTTVKVPVKMLSTTQLRNLAHIGGKVMKTGPHKVSKGQRVIPAAKVKRVDKILRKK